MRSIAVVLCLFCCQAAARDIFGEFAQYTDEERDWLRNQNIPGTRSRCCDENDGTKAQEENINPYVVSFEACRMNYLGDTARNECRSVASMRVPDEAVIHGANHIGRPVVWYYWDRETVMIKCYLPGAGV